MRTAKAERSIFEKGGLYVIKLGIKWSFYALYLCGFITVVFATAHHFYYRKLEVTVASFDTSFQKYKHVDPEAIMHLGRLNQNRRLSFLAFEKAKPQGTIRIGCFGDSYTYGTEVFDGYDYPSYLQKLFEEAGYKHVEVINFGNGWYGYHQAFIMWKYIGRDYDLDYVLLGPKSFQPRRDSRFNHAPEDAPYFIHSRYILAGDGVRLVSVPGRNYREKFENYFKFIPDLSIWKYDRNTPPFLKAIVGKNKEIENPFYYSERTLRDEVMETYYRLLREMVAHGDSQFVLLHVDPEVVATGARITSENLYVNEIELPYEFPFVAQVSHMSPFGNYFVARRYFDLLTGSEETRSFDVSVDMLENAVQPASHLSFPTSQFRLTLRTSQRLIAFLESKLEPQYWLALDYKQFASSKLLPIDVPLKSDDPVYLYLEGEKEKARHLVGKIRHMGSRIPVAAIEFTEQFNQIAADIIADGAAAGRSAVLEVGGKVVAEVNGEDKRLSVQPTDPNVSRFVVMPNVDGRLEHEFDGQIVYLVWEGKRENQLHSAPIGKMNIRLEKNAYKTLPVAAQINTRRRAEL